MNRQSGQAIVELAIIMPVILALLFGTVMVGSLIHNKLVLTNAAREAGRIAAVGASHQAIVQRAEEIMANAASVGRSRLG